MENGEKPNPVDLARNKLTGAIEAPNFNGAQVIIGLDQLEGVLHEAGVAPLNVFTELAAHAISARDRMSDDKVQSRMFELKASNYTRTAELLMMQQQAAAAVEPVTAVATELRASQPQILSTENPTPKTEPAKAPRKPRAASPARAVATSAPTNTRTLPSTNSAKR